MKQRYIYIIGTIFLGIAILLIIYPNDTNKETEKQILLEDLEAYEEANTRANEEEEENENEDTLEEKQQDKEIEVAQFPERISDATKSTIDFFHDNHMNIVAIGDSLTQGVGDSTNQGGYIGILERTINTNEEIIQFENYGKRGQRSEQLLKRLVEEEEISFAITDADIVLITIGANDIMQVAKENIMHLTLNDFIEQRVNFEKNLGEIVSRIRSLNKNSDIYLLGFYNPFEKYFQDIEELNIIVETYNSTTSSIAKNHQNTTFIPTVDLFQNTDINLFADDNFHPNYQGYHRIAERVLNYITNEES